MNRILLCFLFVIFAGYACSDGDHKTDSDDDFSCVDDGSDIVGKWKLLRTKTSGMFSSLPVVYDYSSNNIIYEFKANGELVISSDVEGMLSGEFNYEFKSSKDESTLIIDKRISPLTFCISQKSMIFNDAPVDGGITYFERIK